MIKIPILKINQNENSYYLGKIKVKDLASIATNKIRRTYDKQKLKGYFIDIDNQITNEIQQGNIWYLKDILSDPNIQREQSKERIYEIAEYLSKENTLFPNSIIINLSSISPNEDINKLIKIDAEFLEFDSSKVVATVIDGQHRLAAFNYISDSQLKKRLMDSFELIITIFVGLEVPQQAELFATINGKQKPVNKSILYDLSELSEEEYTELMTAHLIVKWFNVTENSPWFGMIKMLGAGEGMVSQAAFVDGLLPLFEETTVKSNSKRIPIFRLLFLKKEEKKIISILYNYFKTIKEFFPNEWNNPEYILTKTTGLGAMLKLIPSIYYYLHSTNSEYNIHDYVSLINKLEGFDFKSIKYSGGGEALQNQLFLDLKKRIFQEIDIEKFERLYREKYLANIVILNSKTKPLLSY